MNKLIVTLLLICIIGTGYSIYFQQIYLPKKVQDCQKVATNLERMRHDPMDDLEVTNLDISLYMKNLVSCLAD